MKEQIKIKIIEKYGSLENFWKERNRKSRETCLRKYGVKNPNQVKEIKEKSKKTCLEKYGFDNPCKNAEIKKKIREQGMRTSLEKYGFTSSLQNPVIKEKARQTNLKKYGNEHAMQSEKIKEKRKKVWQELYGQDHPMKNKNILDKYKQTCIDKYGEDHPFKNEEEKEKWIKKSKETTLKIYGVEHHFQSEEVKKAAKETLMKNYGVNHNFNIPECIEKSKEAVKKIIDKNKNGQFNIYHTLKGELFWQMLESQNYTLNQLCKHFNINYKSLNKSLSKKKYKDKFRSLYKYPNQQSQKELLHAIEKLNLINTKNINFNDRKTIKPLELDIYLPDYKIGIEFNGNYWHSTACLEEKKAKIKHITKYNMCKAKGITLFNIFESYWKYKKEQIINILKYQLDIYNTLIDINDCTFTETFNKEFFEKYTVEDFNIDNEIYLNVNYNNQTIMLLCFYKDNNILHLNQIVYDSNFKIKNPEIFNKKLKTMITEYNCDQIKIISDNNLDTGKLLTYLMFKEKEFIEPNVFYWNEKFKKYVTYDETLKSFKLFNCGRTVYYIKK